MLPAIKTYYKAPVIKIITYWCMDTLLDWWNRIEFRNTSTLVWWTVLWQRHQDKFVCCSVAKLCLTLCNCVNYSAPGFPFLHCLLEFAQTQVHWVSDAIQPSPPLMPPSSPVHYLSQHQGIGASASVLPVNIQGWFPLGLTSLISLLSKGRSRVFFSIQPSLWSNFHICTWQLEKP